MTRSLVLCALVFALAAGVAAAQDRPPVDAERTLYFKLPIAQTRHHWRFADRDAFLRGRLTLRIVRNDGEQVIVVFDAGNLTPGWDLIESGPAQEAYFGFESTTRYMTGSSDSLEVELEVPEDLPGVGPRVSGVLRSGQYRASGSYSVLIGYWSETWLEAIAELEGIPLAELESMPEAKALVERLNESTTPPELSAAIQCWHSAWDVVETGPGWLTDEEVARNDSSEAASRAQLAEMRASLRELGLDPGPEGPVGTDGRPCFWPGG